MGNLFADIHNGVSTLPAQLHGDHAIIQAFDLKNIFYAFLHIYKYLHFPLMPAKKQPNIFHWRKRKEEEEKRWEEREKLSTYISFDIWLLFLI